MPGIRLPEYPYGHPKNEDFAYDKWRQEMDDNARDAAEAEFDKWWQFKDHNIFIECTAVSSGGFHAPAVEDPKDLARRAYLAAREATARRCVEICHQELLAAALCVGQLHSASMAKETAAALESAIKKEFGL